MKKATIQLEDLTCPSCVLKIEGALKDLDGIDNESVKVQFNASKAKVNFDESKVDIDKIEFAIQKMGYDVLKSTVK
ncbi:MAG: heavy-metal-associated domain-containing protein [Tissierellia bacterium]|nr:heavy-metal-associated domain-containing protein [Tissierellia bacterium]